MEIAIRTVGYVVLAFISIALLFSLIHDFGSRADEVYCNAIGSLFSDSSCSVHEVPSLTIDNEDELAAAIVSCSEKPEGLCYTLYLSRDMSSDKVLSSLEDAKIDLSVSLGELNRGIVSVKKKSNSVEVK